MASQSATLLAIGFSQITCLPAWAALIACSACRLLGDHDVDDVDVWIAGQFVDIVVVPDVGFGEAVLPAPKGALVAGAGHDPGQAGTAGRA